MVIMYFAQVRIFSDLGWIVAATTSFGIFIALFVFPPLLMWIGPQKNQCHVRWWLDLCHVPTERCFGPKLRWDDDYDDDEDIETLGDEESLSLSLSHVDEEPQPGATAGGAGGTVELAARGGGSVFKYKPPSAADAAADRYCLGPLDPRRHRRPRRRLLPPTA